MGTAQQVWSILNTEQGPPNSTIMEAYKQIPKENEDKRKYSSVAYSTNASLRLHGPVIPKFLLTH